MGNIRLFFREDRTRSLKKLQLPVHLVMSILWAQKNIKIQNRTATKSDCLVFQNVMSVLRDAR